MPRLKTVSNLASLASSQALNNLKVNPEHIALFCSEKEGEFLLNSLPDVKPAADLEQFPKLKTKIVKSHLKLQASARNAFKLALASNQIRGEDKFIVLNSQMFEMNQSESLRKEASFSLQRMKELLKKETKVQQKLTKAIQAFPIQSISNSPQLSNKWILDDLLPTSQQIFTHPYTLLINPTILYGCQPSILPEQCVSFPFMQFMIPRYNRLLIHYYNENFKSQFVYTSGFVSRVIQHQCQHLEGKTVLDWRINHGNLTINDSVLKYFPKATAVVDDYSKSLKTIFKQFPDIAQVSDQYCIEGKKLDQLLGQILRANQLISDEQAIQTQKPSKGRNSSRLINNQLSSSNNYNSDFTINKKIFTDQLPFQDDFVIRIVKHFKKEFSKFDEKVQLGLISPEQITKNHQQEHLQTKTIEVTYNEGEYSKLVKIKYLNSQKDVKTDSNGTENKQKTTTEDGQEQELQDKELEKALARHKKGKKRK